MRPFFREDFEPFFHIGVKKLKNEVKNEIFRQMSLTSTLALDVPVRPMHAKGLITPSFKCINFKMSELANILGREEGKFYQELLKEKSNPRLKGNRKGIIVKGKEFYIPILNTFPTR